MATLARRGHSPIEHNNVFNSFTIDDALPAENLTTREVYRKHFFKIF